MYSQLLIWSQLFPILVIKVCIYHGEILWIFLVLAFSTLALTHCAVVLIRASQVQFLAYFLILFLSFFPSFTILNKTWQKSKNKIKIGILTSSMRLILALVLEASGHFRMVTDTHKQADEISSNPQQKPQKQ